MIKKLWLKLVLLYTGITGLILALCLGITFFFSCNRYEASLDAQICDQIESYQIKLLSSRQVDQSTLQELEENLDGNIPLLYALRESLFQSLCIVLPSKCPLFHHLKISVSIFKLKFEGLISL